jgi:hypothetical protein
MSTKAIREALEAFAALAGGRQHIEKALAEVEAIEKAAPAIVCGAEDVLTGFEPGADFDKAVGLMKAIARESGQ